MSEKDNNPHAGEGSSGTGVPGSRVSSSDTDAMTDYLTAEETLSDPPESMEERLVRPPLRRSTRTRRNREILTYEAGFEPKIKRYGSLYSITHH